MKKKKQEDYEKALSDSFDRWNYLYQKGGQDPFYSDGVNLNLVRNHIIYYKRQIEETMKPEQYPDIYNRETPPEVSMDYMANPDEIRAAAEKTLSVLSGDTNYKYLKEKFYQLSPKERAETGLVNIMGYLRHLSNAMKEDDLVTLRRYKNPDYYITSFKEMTVKVKNILFQPGRPANNEQVSLFDRLVV